MTKIFENVKKYALSLLVAVMALGSVIALAGNNDYTSARVCSRVTAPGNNRSGVCSLRDGNQLGTMDFSHQQFSLSTTGRNVSGTTMLISVTNVLTSANTSIVTAGQTTTVTRTRVVGHGPRSGAFLN